MKRKISKKKIILSCILWATAVFVFWVLWANTALQLTEITLESEKLPQSFNGFRIAHVSDLHNAEMGKDNRNLLEMLKNAQPDIIVITGDIIDSRRTDTDTAIKFVYAAAEIAPCYYVEGNHETRLPEEYEILKNSMEEAGVTVLENESAIIEKDGGYICVAGVKDPTSVSAVSEEYGNVMREFLQAVPTDDTFCILLAHRPELFDIYCEYGADLVLSGHAHGGQIRLPFIGGIYVPNQGLFPEFTEGLHVKDSTSMVISRGIGNSSFPLRFNNRPEVILITLYTL